MKGTIRRRVNGDGSTSFVCQVKAGRDPATGKQRVLTGTAKSERAAHKLVHDLIAKATSSDAPAADVTLNDLIARWLELGGPPEASTRLTYQGYIRNHIEPDVGRLKLGRLKPEDLDRWYARLKEKGLAAASIRKCHVIVSGALSQGRRWGWVPTNVAQLATPPTVHKAVIRTPDPEQVRRILAAAAGAEPDLAAYLRLAAVSGARPGELCGLRWIDLDRGTGDLVIRRRVTRGEHGPVLVDLTKTHKTRTIPLDRSTVAVLGDLRTWMDDRAATCGTRLVADAHVFSYEVDGSTYWQPMVIARRFRTLVRREGLGDLTLYSLRHQAATVMIDAGVDAKTVSERLGNSVITVLTTYTRARTHADRAAADLMGSLYAVETSPG